MPRSTSVVLEAPSIERQAEFLRAVGRSRRLHRRWVVPPRTAAQYQAFLERIRQPDHIGHFVCTRTGDLVAVININAIVRGVFQSGYLGYYTFAPHEGQGYMRQGLELVLRAAFGKYRLHRVEANIQPDNVRSISLVRRLGFRREGYSPRYLKVAGRWCDHERWALTIEDYKRL
jgi:ribosomal-protein-alanine N-acetyltransferase